MQISMCFSCYISFFINLISEHKDLSKICKVFSIQFLLSFQHQIFKYMLNNLPLESRFTLFPIYSDVKILSKYSQIGFNMKGNGLYIPKMANILTYVNTRFKSYGPKHPFLIKTLKNRT